MLGRIIEIIISSNLQRRPSIFEEFFMLGRIIKIFISSILQRRPSIFKEFFLLGRIKKNIYFFKSARKPKDIYYLMSFLCLVEK